MIPSILKCTTCPKVAPKEDKPLSKGDLLRIKIKLNDVERAHTLNARVVWTTEKGSFSGRSGIGMKFVKPEDIHRFLMDKIY